MAQSSALINVMSAAAGKAGRSLVRAFGEIEGLQVSKKGPADFVSEAEHRAEKVLFEELSKARPNYGFVMEEGGGVAGSDTSNTWIIDPLDGTLNFLHGLPHFAISIALERDGDLFCTADTIDESELFKVMLRPTYMDRFGGPLDTEFIQPTLTDVNRQLQEELDQSLDHIARLDASVVHDCCAGFGTWVWFFLDLTAANSLVLKQASLLQG